MTAVATPTLGRRHRTAAATRAVTAHRSDVQGLRAVAVVLVALAHARVAGVAGGFVGVDVFFVLSGFLITGLLLAEADKHGSISLVEFYVRRARRLLPAATLTLVTTSIASVYVLNFVRARTAVGDGMHAAAFSANFRFAARGVDYFAQSDPPSPFLHFWSLSVEEQFYFVWPLLLSLALVRRGSRARLLAVVLMLTGASLAWSVHATASVPAAAYFSPFTRAWELAIGATLAVAQPTLAQAPARAKLALGWTGAAAIAGAAVFFSGATAFPGYAALLPTLGAGCAIVAGMGVSASRFGATRVLALRPLAFVGDRSYAFYLWHWPLLTLAAQSTGHDLPVTANVAILAAAFLLSCLSYALVEDPVRTKMKSRKKTAVVALVCVAGMLATAAGSLAAIEREQQRFEGPVTRSHPFTAAAYRAAGPTGALPAVVAAVAAADRGDPLPRGLTPPIGSLRDFPAPYMPPAGCVLHDHDSGTTSRICRVGHPSSKKVVVLLGDSHALEWLPSLFETALHDDWAVVPLLRLGCTPSKWVSSSGTTCRAWFHWAVSQAERLHPQAILIGGSIDQVDSPTTRRAIDGVLTAARSLKPYATHVAVIGDPEGLAEDPVDCLLSNHATMATCTTRWPASALNGYDTVARRTKQLHVGFLPTRGFVCSRAQCPAVIGNTIAWMDTNHMTVAYAVQLAGAFRARFLGLLRS